MIILCMTVIVIGLLAGYLWLTETHHDASALLTALIAVIGAGMPGVAAVSKAEQVGQQVQVIQNQTNGNVSRMLDMIQQGMTSQRETSLDAHVTAQQAITAVTTVAESPTVPVAAVPLLRDPPPPGAAEDPPQ